MKRRSARADFLSRFLGLDFGQSLGEEIGNLLERRIGHGDPDSLDIFNGTSAKFARRTCHGDQNNSWSLANVDAGDEHWSVVWHLILDYSPTPTREREDWFRTGTDFTAEPELQSTILKFKISPSFDILMRACGPRPSFSYVTYLFQSGMQPFPVCR
jgi:hypothetical protein